MSDRYFVITGICCSNKYMYIVVMFSRLEGQCTCNLYHIGVHHHFADATQKFSESVIEGTDRIPVRQICSDPHYAKCKYITFSHSP